MPYCQIGLEETVPRRYLSLLQSLAHTSHSLRSYPRSLLAPLAAAHTSPARFARGLGPR